MSLILVGRDILCTDNFLERSAVQCDQSLRRVSCICDKILQYTSLLGNDLNKVMNIRKLIIRQLLEQVWLDFFKQQILE